MLCTGCWVPVGRHDPCRRCKSVHTVTRRDEVITPYGSRPDTQGNNHNRPAAHCYARQITGAQSCGKKKKESADLQSTLSSFLAANATLSGAKESWGVARGDRKPWCPVPFCPSPPGGGNTPPSVGENPPSPGLGTTLASCVCAAGTAESFALSLEGRKGTLSLREKKKSTHFRECLNSGGVGGARTHDLSRVRRTL